MINEIIPYNQQPLGKEPLTENEKVPTVPSEPLSITPNPDIDKIIKDLQSPPLPPAVGDITKRDVGEKQVQHPLRKQISAQPSKTPEKAPKPAISETPLNEYQKYRKKNPLPSIELPDERRKRKEKTEKKKETEPKERYVRPVIDVPLGLGASFVLDMTEPVDSVKNTARLELVARWVQGNLHQPESLYELAQSEKAVVDAYNSPKPGSKPRETALTTILKQYPQLSYLNPVDLTNQMFSTAGPDEQAAIGAVRSAWSECTAFIKRVNERSGKYKTCPALLPCFVSNQDSFELDSWQYFREGVSFLTAHLGQTEMKDVAEAQAYVNGLRELNDQPPHIQLMCRLQEYPFVQVHIGDEKFLPPTNSFDDVINTGISTLPDKKPPPLRDHEYVNWLLQFMPRDTVMKVLQEMGPAYGLFNERPSWLERGKFDIGFLVQPYRQPDAAADWEKEMKVYEDNARLLADFSLVVMPAVTYMQIQDELPNYAPGLSGMTKWVREKGLKFDWEIKPPPDLPKKCSFELGKPNDLEAYYILEFLTNRILRQDWRLTEHGEDDQIVLELAQLVNPAIGSTNLGETPLFADVFIQKLREKGFLIASDEKSGNLQWNDNASDLYHFSVYAIAKILDIPSENVSKLAGLLSQLNDDYEISYDVFQDRVKQQSIAGLLHKSWAGIICGPLDLGIDLREKTFDRLGISDEKRLARVKVSPTYLRDFRRAIDYIAHQVDQHFIHPISFFAERTIIREYNQENPPEQRRADLEQERAELSEKLKTFEAQKEMAIETLGQFEKGQNKPSALAEIEKWENGIRWGDDETYIKWDQLRGKTFYLGEITRRLKHDIQRVDVALTKKFEPVPDPSIPVGEMVHYWVRPYLSSCALELFRSNRDIDITDTIDRKERSKYSFSQEEKGGYVVTARSKAIAKVLDLLVRLDKVVESKGEWREVENVLAQAELVFKEFEDLMPQMIEKTKDKESGTYYEPGSVYALLDYPNVIDMEPSEPEDRDKIREPIPDQLTEEGHVLDLSERLDQEAFRSVLVSLSAEELQKMTDTLTTTMKATGRVSFWDIIQGITPKGKERLRRLRSLQIENQSMNNIVALINEVMELRNG